jgi:hypothetical protein
MRQAYHAESALKAEGLLAGLAAELDKTHPGAAASLREGMAETLTILRLGVLTGPRAGSTLPLTGTSAGSTKPRSSPIRGLVERSRVAPLTRRHWARSPGRRRWS